MSTDLVTHSGNAVTVGGGTTSAFDMTLTVADVAGPAPAPAEEARQGLEAWGGAGRALVAAWSRYGAFKAKLAAAQTEARAVVLSMGRERDQLAFMATFDRDLPATARAAVYDFLTIGRPSYVRDATPEQMAAFTGHVDGALLAAKWGADAPQMVGRYQTRMGLLLSHVTEADREALLDWFDRLPTASGRALMEAMAK